MFTSMKNIPLSIKLPVVISSITLTMALSLGFYNYRSTKNTVTHLAVERMDGAATIRAEEIKNYLSTIDQDLKITVASPFVAEATKAFTATWKQLGSMVEQDLQKAYIHDNPHPTGNKDKLVQAGQSSYDIAHGHYHPWFHTLMSERSYYDIFLIDMDGNLIYSVFKEADYATNLTSGKWRNTDLGKIFQKASQSAAGSISFTDFSPYAPSNNAPASFIAAPIVSGGEKIGVLAFQMPIDTINKLMTEDSRLGKTGETLLIGQDRLMRNDSTFTSNKNDILQTKINPIQIQEDGETGWLEGYRNEQFVAFSHKFTFHNVPYEVVAIEAVGEINAPIVSQRNATILITSLILLGSIIASLLFSRSIVNPIRLLVDRAGELAKGNTNISFKELDRKDELGTIASAIAAFRNNVEQQNKLAAESEQAAKAQLERQNQIDELINTFKDEVSNRLSNLSDNASSMNKVASSLSDQARKTSSLSTNVSASSEEASTNVHTVAAAAEELS
ncbi:MAG: methyl-accepting chemotaxis protein, partial [Cohaesibacter sp.]|nr:methyl-accepting chemotaxis protein [Cohaesibacter sp.]